MLSQKTRRGITTGFVLLFVYLLGSLAAGIFLAEISLHLPKRPLAHRAEFELVLREQFHAPLQDVSISTNDGVQLKAWYASPQLFNGSTVILLHGVTDNRTGVAGYARMFLKHGYAVLLPDARAHGESGGEIATYGLKERYDIREWTRWVHERSHGCVYLFGESMGAAIALQATAVAPDLCAVAVESPYSTFREIAYDRVARVAHTGTWFARTIARPMLEFSMLYARLRYKVDLSQASPEYALERSTIPTLLIHGTADKNIPLRHSEELIRCCSSHTQLWVVNGADHGGAVNVAKEEFETRVLEWFQSHP